MGQSSSLSVMKSSWLLLSQGSCRSHDVIISTATAKHNNNHCHRHRHRHRHWVSLSSYLRDDDVGAVVYQANRRNDDEVDPTETTDNERKYQSSSDPLPSLLLQLDQSFDYEGRMNDGTSSIYWQQPQNQYRCGYVCIVGIPNVGKSTLLNALLSTSLCITSSRPQTTRHAILGLLSSTSSSSSSSSSNNNNNSNNNNVQVCFIDTPGIIASPAYALQRGMMEAVTGAIYDADVFLIVSDIYSTPNDVDQLLSDSTYQRVLRQNKPILVAINKVDLLSSSSSSLFTNMTHSSISSTISNSTNGAKKKSQKKKHMDDNVVVVGAAAAAAAAEMSTPPRIEEVIMRWRQYIPQALAIIPVCAANGSHDVGVQAIRTVLLGGCHDMVHINNHTSSSPWSMLDVPTAFRNLGRPIPGMLASANITYLTNEQARALLPISPPLYDHDIITDRSSRFIASEMIRVALFESLRKELPYCCEVQVTAFKDPHEILSSSSLSSTTTSKSNTNNSMSLTSVNKRNKPSSTVLRIEATVFVERESQKVIVIGKHGEQIKRVGILARKKLEDFFQSQVRSHEIYL
jgi:small GTP-binding protein